MIAIVYFDRADFPSDFCNPEPYEDAVTHAKKLAQDGFDTTVYKLIETHHYKGEPVKVKP